MLFLILSVLSSTILGLLFKFFPKYGINTFQAIVVNYFICVICGTLVLGELPLSIDTFNEDWFPQASLLGILFISGFYTVGMTVLLYGLTIAQVLQKMTLIISVPFAILMFKEAAAPTKVIGIIIALAAVVLSNWPQKNKEGEDSKISQELPFSKAVLWFFPLYAFVASAGIECGIQYVEHSYLAGSDASAAKFSSTIFASAGLLGTLVIVYLMIFKKTKLEFKNILAGVLLGIPNYFSIYFLIKAFGYWDKSIVLPVNNISIVGLSALLGLLMFKEKLSFMNWLGVALAAIAILLIGL
jgi:drug/metabolite transporter (DMT)-like permease